MRKSIGVGKTTPRGGSRATPDYQIFVSHATSDKWIARVICEKLEKIAGVTTFRDDRDIQGGEEIPDTVFQGIKRPRELLVLLTPHSVNRPWVLLEIGAALGRRKSFPIVAVLYHVAADGIPEMLKSKKAIPLNDFDNSLAEVAERLKRWVT